MNNVLVIGDLHEPATHPGYLSFTQDVAEEWGCDEVVFIGDLVDHHAISFHASHPEAPGPMEEYNLAYGRIQRWYTHFPEATVLIGNHDARPERLAATSNIPAHFLRDHAEVWGTPGWEWVFEEEIDGVHYTHGTGARGVNPAYTLAMKMGMSVVMGHTHHAGGVRYIVGPKHRWFAMDTGCGVDRESLMMSYGKHFQQKPVLGCGVVTDGEDAHFVPMKIGRGESYHRSRFRKDGLRKAGR